MNKKLDAAGLIRKARAESGLSLRASAKRAGTSHATLSAYEHGRKKPSHETLVRIIESLGFIFDVQLRRRIRYSNGLERGDELIQVLELVEQFPTPPRRPLTFPKFPAR